MHGPGNRRDTRNKRQKNGRRWKVSPSENKDEPQRSFPQTRDVKRLLEGIGTPPIAPFQPDPFQIEALAALELGDVLVTADDESTLAVSDAMTRGLLLVEVP